MAITVKRKQCSNCGSIDIVETTEEYKVVVDGDEYSDNLSATRCNKCQQVVITGQDIKLFEQNCGVNLMEKYGVTQAAKDFIKKVFAN